MPLEIYQHLDVFDEGWTDGFGKTGYGVEDYIPRTKFKHNSADFEGDTNEFRPEVLATNPTGSPIDMTIVRTDTLAEVGGISVPAGVTRKRLRGDLFTFPAGDIEHAWMVDRATAADTEFQWFTGRVWGHHINPSKLKVWHPLVNYTDGDCNGVQDQIDLLNSGVGVRQFTAWSGIFVLDLAEFTADTISWGLESIVGKSLGSAVNFRWGLYNVTLGAEVAASIMSGNTPDITGALGAIAWASDPNWIDGHKYRWFWMENVSSLNTVKMFGARLYTYLSGNITKVTTRYRVMKGGGTSLPTTNNPSRVLAETSANLISVMCEASGYMGAGTGAIDVKDDGTNDDGLGGTVVPAARVTVGASHDRWQSSTWAITNGNRYIETDTPSGGPLHIDWDLIRFLWQATDVPFQCPPKVTIEPVCKTGGSTPVCKNGTIECC